MAITKEHELHKRRLSRNVGLGLTLGAFIIIVFGMTVVKVSRGDFAMQPTANSTLIQTDQTGGASDGN